MKLLFLLNIARSFLSYVIINLSFLSVMIIGAIIQVINTYWGKYFVFVLGTIYTVALCKLLGLRVSVDKLKSDKPMLVVSNHTHEFDTIILTTALNIPSYIAKKSLKIFPVFDHFIFLDRNGRDLDFLKQAEDRVSKGQCVVIFPEGTRVKEGDTKPYSRSLALLARRLDVPVALYAMNVGKVMKKWKGLAHILFDKTIHVKQIGIVNYDEVIFSEICNTDVSDVDTGIFRLTELNQALKFLSKKNKVHGYLHDIVSPWVLDKDLEMADLDNFLQKSAPFDGINIVNIKSDILRSVAAVKRMNMMSNSEKDTLFTQYAEKTIRAAVDQLS